MARTCPRVDTLLSTLPASWAPMVHHGPDMRSHDPPAQLVAASPISVAEAIAFRASAIRAKLGRLVLVHLHHVQFEPAPMM